MKGGARGLLDLPVGFGVRADRPQGGRDSGRRGRAGPSAQASGLIHGKMAPSRQDDAVTRLEFADGAALGPGRHNGRRGRRQCPQRHDHGDRAGRALRPGPAPPTPWPGGRRSARKVHCRPALRRPPLSRHRPKATRHSCTTHRRAASAIAETDRELRGGGDCAEPRGPVFPGLRLRRRPRPPPRPPTDRRGRGRRPPDHRLARPRSQVRAKQGMQVLQELFDWKAGLGLRDAG